MRRLALLASILASGCSAFHRAPPPQTAPKFGASLLFPGGGSSSGGGGTVTQGTAAAGSGAWPVALTENGTDTIVKTADNANKAVRVNIVAGASSGAVAQGSTTSGQTGGLTQGAVTTAAPTYTTAQTDPLSLTTAGALRVDGSGVTQPVSGTVTASQGGTWTVQPGNTANTTAWKVDGSAVTQPVSGTVTANAGTNLNTSALALDATLTQLTLTQGAATAGQKGPLTLCAVTTGAPSYTTAQSSPCSLTLAGALRVDSSANTQPVSGTVAATQSGAWSLSANQSVNVAQINGVTPLMGNGITGTGSPRVTIASDNTAFTVNAAQSGTWTVQPGNTANSTAWLVAGGKTNNNAAPGATNFGVLPALANAAAPSWTEGNLVLQSVLLNGSARNDITSVNGVTPLMGNGVTGTGSMRVTLASDTSTNTNPFNVQGAKTNNNAAPGATNIGAMAALANASAPSWTEGNLVLHSVLLNGSQRNDLTSVAGTATATNNGTVSAGVLRVTIASDSTGNLGVAQASTTSGQIGPLGQGAVTTNSPAYTTAQTSPLSLDTAGNLRVAQMPVNTTTGDSGAKTATGNGATQTNTVGIGAVITARVGTVSGTTPTFALNFQYSPDGGTTWVQVGANSATITNTGTVTLIVGPGLLTGTTVTALSNQAAVGLVASPVPRTWRVGWVIGGTTPSFTITAINVDYIP